MKYILPLLILMGCVIPQCPGQAFPNPDFQNSQVVPCLNDSASAPVLGFVEWEGYQTTDSTWDGPRTLQCIALDQVAGGSGAEIRMGDVTDTLPFYLRSRLDTLGAIPLDTNGLYKISLFVSSTGIESSFHSGDTCKENLCTGFRIGIQIPDSTGTTTDMRWYNGHLDTLTGNVEFCIPTERFLNGNNLTEGILKFFKQDPIAPSVQLNLFAVQIENMSWETIKHYRMDAPPGFGGYEFVMTPWDWPGPNHIAMYGDTTYPSAAHPSYCEIFPLPNSTTQENISVIVEPDAFFTQQPFTYLRGGLVLGDTIRHNFTLIDNGGSICMHQFVEVLIEQGNQFMYRSGNVNFEGSRACMLFGKQGKLVVEKGAKFNYGSQGLGILALRTGGIVEIGKGSELIIGNHLSLSEYRGETADPQLSISLNKGSKLTFAPGAYLTYDGLISPQPQLTIYMNGGQLDDSALSPESRALIRRVYQSPSAQLEDNLHVHGNPFADELSFSLTLPEAQTIAFTCTDTKGCVLNELTFVAQQGINYVDVPVRTWAPGIYFLTVTTAQGTVTRRIEKLK